MLAQDALHNEPQDSFNKEWIVSNFDKCLNNGHFHIYLQPQVDMNGKIHGAEVLARWIEADDEECDASFLRKESCGCYSHWSLQDICSL